MTISLFSTDEVIKMCLNMTIDELNTKIVEITHRMAQPDTLSYFEPERNRDMNRIKIIHKIISLKNLK